MLWDGKRWARAADCLIEARAKQVVKAMYAEAATLDDDEERAALVKWAQKSESARVLAAMVHLVTSESGIPIRPEEFDCDLWLLNCENGTIELRTGTLREHRREDYITKLAPVSYDPEAEAPTWHALLNRIMDGNAEMITYLRRATGYTVTGDTGERCVLVGHGAGANGKSTLLETIARVMGDYAKSTRPETIMSRHRTGSIPNDVAALRGARLVTTVEFEQGRRLQESLVKQLTGGDTVSARFLHAEYFEFRPTFKVWLATNHKPVIRGTDDAIWERIRLIPFEVTIPEKERDHRLQDRLWEEAPGILLWAIQGCLEWQESGSGCRHRCSWRRQGTGLKWT